MNYLRDTNDDVPEPVSESEAKSLLGEWELDDTGLVAVTWRQVSVNPDVLADGIAEVGCYGRLR